MSQRMLATLLAQTLGAPGTLLKQAEEQLQAAEAHSGFGPTLLHLLQDQSIDGTVRQAGAIYFKNFVKRRWGPPPEQGGVAAADRTILKENIVPVMLQAPRPVQMQLCASLQEMASMDFPESWPTLLPDLCRHANSSSDIHVWTGVVEAAATVFVRFREGAWRDNLLEEVRQCVSVFGPTHLQVLQVTAERLSSSAVAADAASRRAHLHLLHVAAEVFEDLNSAILTDFFKEHRDAYFSLFIALLGISAESASSDDASPLELLKGQICDNMSLYADRYEEDFQVYVGSCVEAVWKLLVGLNPHEGNDRLAARGMNFLAAVATTKWPTSPFADRAALTAICERVILANIQLRPSEVEAFSEDAVEYIRRDAAGADKDTRRRSVLELIKALRRFHDAQVTEILIPYVTQLLDKMKTTSDSSGAVLCKDACITLVAALTGAAPGTGGKKVDVMQQFFTAQTAPELEAEFTEDRAIARATCIKFVHYFVSELPEQQLQALLPHIAKHVLCSNAVLHTYAALCAAEVVSEKKKVGTGSQFRFSPAAMQPTLVPLVGMVLQIMFSGKGIPQNEHLAASVVAILHFLEGSHCIDTALMSLRGFVQIVDLAAVNPANPDYIHNIFEGIAICIKMLVPAREADVEQLLLPVIGRILDKNFADFLPYAFQLLGLLLDLVQSSKLQEQFASLLPRLLQEDFWSTAGNVPALNRTLRGYFVKSQIFAVPLQENMPKIFERFRGMICNRKLDSIAFALPTAVFRCAAPALYDPCLTGYVSVVLAQLQSRKSADLERDFVLSLSLLVHLREDGQYLVARLFEQAGAGSFKMYLFEKWLPSTSRAWLQHRRKVFTLGLCKLIHHPEVCGDAKLLCACCDALLNLMRWKRERVVSWCIMEALKQMMPEDPTTALEAREFQVSFNRLRHTEVAPGVATGSAADQMTWKGGLDLVPEVRDANALAETVRRALVPLRPQLEQLGEAARPLLQACAQLSA
eukprot:TRINITY_DN76496_c0_g1_i1.p1 TRINITY_DN76496_c0_g1~~TRINITY_DN76496_c0_g1_i1.p1  ORF type:complete len:980 (+),score=200.37 TRINITY_DN76496_c0_g1_i1:116-3055(+)